MSRQELSAPRNTCRQSEPFRTGTRYNNFGPIVAGEILERVSGESWAEFVTRRVFQPLEMGDCVYRRARRTGGRDNVAASYISVEGKLREDPSWTLPLNEGWERFGRRSVRPAPYLQR